MIKAYSGYNQLLHSWIYGDNTFEGHTPGNRMFAEGNDLYSYHRYGATLAKKLDNQTILVDTRNFSRTTSKQQTLLRRAIPSNWNVIYVEDPCQTPRVLIQRSIGLIKDTLALIPKATKYKKIHLDVANGKRRNILKLISIYPEQCSLADFRWLENPFESKDYISEEWLAKEVLRLEKEAKVLEKLKSL